MNIGGTYLGSIPHLFFFTFNSLQVYANKRNVPFYASSQ
uniref:Uncharacterized protein MANES_04G016200 n=1 Tax=Rhizophora mucronata TaxID=61149 RepID=A0A2P2L812_RHIMU